MDDDKGMNKLFFELSSESRLKILHELQTDNLRMQEIARRLDLTTTDAFRQLQRLSDGSLVQRQPDGAYAITEYGKLVLQLLPSFDFAFKHSAYLLTHEIRKLPYQFVNRIGELSRAELRTDTVENLNHADQMAKEADRFFWAIGVERPLKSTESVILERAAHGIDFRFLFPQQFVPQKETLSLGPKNVEWRSLNEVPVTMVLTEKEAGIAFRLIGGKIDYAGFVGKDPIFLKWAKDLFTHYWDLGKG